MKIKTITNLLLTASSLFIIGCSNTDDDSSSSSKKRTEVSKDSQMPLYLSHANNIHNNGEALDALSASNITDASYIKNSLANRSRLASNTQAAALRLSDTTGHKELPKATEDKPVLFDMLGSTDPKHPRTLNHINREGRISGLYMEHVKVSMESGGRMDTLVAHAKNTEIATNTSAPFTAHAFYLDERASVTGNDQIHFADTRFGTTLEGLKKAHPKRYDQQTKGGISLEGGEFVIKGIMVKQTIPKGMTLRAFGTETRINNLTHSGGSLVVKGSSKLHVTNYEVTENSPFEFFWDTNFREARFVIEGQLKMSGAIGIRLAVDASVIQTGEIANIIKFDPSNVDFGGKEIGDRFEKGISRFGASFTGGPDLASGVVKLEVTNAGTYESNTSGLSNSTRQLAAGIMNSDTPLKSHLMVAEIDEARSSLIESTSETAFAPEQYWKTPNFNALLQLNPQQATWLHTHETAETEFTAAGIKLTQNLYAGLSLMNHQTEENQTSAFHIFNQNTLLSCFNAPKSLGVQISKQLGVFEAGLTYTYAERSGTHTTKLWDIAIHQAFQQQTTAHLGMNFELNQSTQPPISVGIKALFDLYKRIGDHSAKINDNTFKIKGYELSKGLGIQFNTTIPFKCGQLAFAYDAYHASHRLSSNVSLNFQLEN